MAMSTERPSQGNVPLNSAGLLRLMQMVSPALPVGAFAYSHGLEWAVSAGWVNTAAQAEAWVGGLLRHVWARLDVPGLGRILAALQAGDLARVAHWSERLQAGRESAELRAEDRLMGQALARLLADLGVSRAAEWVSDPRCSFPVPWACAAAHWQIPAQPAGLGLLWTYAEHQVAAAVKLVPLGQTAGQRMLQRLIELIPPAVEEGLRLPDADIGGIAPALGIASARHETQYTRLFRS